MGFLRICKDMCNGTSMGGGSQNQEFLVKGRHNQDDYIVLEVYLGVPSFVETTKITQNRKRQSPHCSSIDAASTYTHMPKP